MINRTIKLRVWDEVEQVFSPLHILPGPDETRPVVEFTGVYDATGTEVWEGDILYWHYFDESVGELIEAYFKVIFRDGCFGTTGINETDFDPFHNLNMGDKVAGNIFADAHLLELHSDPV